MEIDWRLRCCLGGRFCCNHARLTGITYPDGTQIDYHYGNPGSPDDVLNRIETIESELLVLAEYRYLGQNRSVITNYKDEPGVELSYFASGQSGEGGRRIRKLDAKKQNS